MHGPFRPDGGLDFKVERVIASARSSPLIRFRRASLLFPVAALAVAGGVASCEGLGQIQDRPGPGTGSAGMFSAPHDPSGDAGASPTGSATGAAGNGTGVAGASPTGSGTGAAGNSPTGSGTGAAGTTGSGTGAAGNSPTGSGT